LHDLTRQDKLFDTSKLERARLAVIGSGAISNFLCAYLSGLGVGEVVMVDNRIAKCTRDFREFLSALSHRMDPIIDNMAKTMQKMNPNMKVMNYVSNLNKIYMNNCSVIIDTTNNPDSKYLTYKHLEQTEALYISCSSTKICSSIALHDFRTGEGVGLDEIILKEYAGFEQGTFTSGLVAALAADAIRKRVCPVQQDKPLEKRISYSVISEDKFFNGPVPQQHFFSPKTAAKLMEDCKKKNVLVVGAGGIGNYTALNLAMLGVNMTIYDFDTIEPHNLNRQVLLYEGVGNNKAEMIAKRLKKINPRIKVVPKPEMLTMDSLMKARSQGTKYDVIFSCVDSWQTRNILNNYCARTGTPLINAGVDTFISVIDQYIPDGKAHCLACSNDYRNSVDEEVSRIGCNSLEVNVVMPNAVAGALQVAESLKVMSPDSFKGKPSLITMYDSNGIHTFSRYAPVLDCTRKNYYRHNCSCHGHLEVRK